MLFGSEPKAILAHPGFRAELDADGIGELFAPIGARTPGHGVYRGLSEVRPGCLVRVSRTGLTSRAYWELGAWPHADDEAATISRVRELLTDIVDRQLVADVPLCTLLSGGLDSSALTALTARARGRATGRGAAPLRLGRRHNGMLLPPSIYCASACGRILLSGAGPLVR